MALALATLLCYGSIPTRPFLSIPFTEGTQIRVSQGWIYDAEEQSIHPGIPKHYAADFQTKWGTPVYAPADGLAVSSYHLYDMTDSQDRTIGYGLGLFVQVWHEREQLFTSYSHLSGVSDCIPYLPPVHEGQAWQPRQAIYIPLAKFKEQAHLIRKGDLIGYVGWTGLRLGYEESPANPPVIDPRRDRTWDPAGAHLHWRYTHVRPTDPKRTSGTTRSASTENERNTATFSIGYRRTIAALSLPSPTVRPRMPTRPIHPLQHHLASNER